MRSLSDDKFVCIFSILCFGKLRETPFIGQGCQPYTFNKDVISVYCEGSYWLNFPVRVHDIHTLHLVGVGREFFNLELIDLPFRNLVITDWDMSSYVKDIHKVEYLFQRHQTLTAIEVKNLQAWRWADYKFEQIYIEKSSISWRGSQRLSEQDAERLFSWNLVELYIIDTDLLSIDPDVFSHMPLLRTLTLTQNPLSGLKTDSFSTKLYHLWLLDLSYNRITYLESNLFSQLPALKELNLNQNQLKSLPFDLIKPIWFHLDLIHLLENPLDCNHLCWSLQTYSFPHPIAFDQTTCNDFLRNRAVTIGTMKTTTNPICIRYPWDRYQMATNSLKASNHSETS